MCGQSGVSVMPLFSHLGARAEVSVKEEGGVTLLFCMASDKLPFVSIIFFFPRVRALAANSTHAFNLDGCSSLVI